MFSLIVANVRRRVARTALTAGGIAVGVASIVALLSLSTGLDNTAGQLVHLGRADLGLFQADAGDPTSSVLPLSLMPRLLRTPEVVGATPLQLVISAVPKDPSAVVFGAELNGFVAQRLVYTAGGAPSAAAHVAVGDQLASQLHLHVGNMLKLGGRQFVVSGIYNSGIAFEDQGAITSLREAQILDNRTPEETTTIAVRIAPTVSLAKATKEIVKQFPGVSAISDTDEAIRAGANTELISKAVLLIVVLALIIGTLAVANTMLAAVLERRRELALLSTIGWSGPQLGSLVLGEAIAVSMIGTGFGLALGVLFAGALPPALGLGNFITPDQTAWGLGRACLIGVAIGVLGAVYPIWRVTRTSSARALAPG
jgi:putative ABC transport system permease protein